MRFIVCYLVAIYDCAHKGYNREAGFPRDERERESNSSTSPESRVQSPLGGEGVELSHDFIIMMGWRWRKRVFFREEGWGSTRLFLSWDHYEALEYAYRHRGGGGGGGVNRALELKQQKGWRIEGKHPTGDKPINHQINLPERLPRLRPLPKPPPIPTHHPLPPGVLVLPGTGIQQNS